MLTQRDKNILIYLEKYKAISVTQAQYILFNGCYESARRRLKQLESNNILKSYTSFINKEKIYYNNKKLKDHELLVFDFIKILNKKGANIKKLIIQPRLLKDNIRPDAYIEFTYNKNLYFIILEVDYTHTTSNTKMQLYEKLYLTGEFQENCYGTFPIIIVSRNTNSIRYNSKNFDVIYTDFKYSNLDQLLF